jgi:hypothetical protein
VHDWDRLLDDARADAGAGARARERSLRRQAAEGATLAGTLLDLGEAAAALSLWTVAGRRHEGTLLAVGADFALLADRGAHVVVRLDAVTVVRPHPGHGAGPASGDRATELDLTFTELLARLVDDRPEISIGADGAYAIAGTLEAVGVDVLTVRVSPGADGLVYSSADRCASVRFRSG